jgi:hypothetical protein
MIKRYFKGFIMSFGFANLALALDYNPKLLESNAEQLNLKLCSHVVIEPREVLENLNFVYKSDVLKETLSCFEDVREKVSSILTDSRFSEFFETCRGIDESGDDEIKVSIRMLLTSVFNKYSLHFKRLQKLRGAKDDRREIPTPQLLGRADKMVPLDYSDRLFGVKA